MEFRKTGVSMIKRLFPVVVLLGWFIPSVSMALGLGPITMRSALNQSLLAEIDIHSVQTGDLDGLAVRLATEDDFKRVNVERSIYLNNIKFKIMTRADGSAYIRLTTDEPITEPYLDFLIEARWPRGRALKEYTVLVDPPVLSAEAPAPVEQASTTPVFAPPPQPQAQRRAAPAPQAQRETPAQRPARPAAPRPAPRQFTAPASTGPMDYGVVKRGDTLWEIADELRKRSGGDASLHQIMMALLRANPSAFQNGNVNQLKAGYVLRLENPEVIADMSKNEALQEFKRQYREWSSGSGRLVKQVEVAGGDGEDTAEAPAKGSARVSQNDQAKLKLVAPGREGRGSGSGSKDSTESQQLRDDLILATEALDASRQESEDLKARTSELQDQLDSMQRLIMLKDDELSAVQSELKNQTEAEAIPPAEQPKQAEKPAAAPKKEEAASGSFLSDYLLFGVALLAVIGVVAWLVIRRRKMQEGFEESILNVGMGAAAAAAAAAMTNRTSGSRMDSGESSMVSDFAMSDMGGIQPDSAEVDPISEADVYLAYGRHQQAEDIIKQALETNPRRLELHSKLLEVYHAANNRAGFEQQAQVLRNAIGGNEANEYWQRIVGLGRDICPDNPLFGGAEEATISTGDVGFASAMSDVTAEEEDLLDFDFNEDELADLESSTASSVAEDSLDFDVSALDFNLDEDEKPKTKAKAAADDNSIDFDMPTAHGARDDSTELNLSLDSDSEIDLGSIDFETEVHSHDLPTQAIKKPAEMDLSLDDFDNEETLHAASDSHMGSDFNGSSDDFGGSELSLEDLGDDDELSDDIFADVDEIGTKLDLAKAYVDMGDSDGARSILDEVMEEGDDTQKEQAQELLRQIG